MRITYKGNSELVSEFGALLSDEGLDVTSFPDGPAEQSSGADTVHVFEVKMPGPVPQWATTLTRAEIAASKFRERFPDAIAAIEIIGERSDLNVPHAAEYHS